LSSERAPWKITAVSLAATVGVWLGVMGSHAPRLNLAVSGVTRQSAARESRVTPDDPGRRGATIDGAGRRAAATGHKLERSRSPRAGSNGDRERTTTPTTGSSATTAVAAPGASGPLLSDMWYASRAHEIYPVMTVAPSDQILTGFQIKVRPGGGGTETVTVTDLQDNTAQTATISRDNRLYFVETRLGDDGADGETNNGDDGFVVTDTQGRILGP